MNLSFVHPCMVKGGKVCLISVTQVIQITGILSRIQLLSQRDLLPHFYLYQLCLVFKWIYKMSKPTTSSLSLKIFPLYSNKWLVLQNWVPQKKLESPKKGTLLEESQIWFKLESVFQFKSESAHLNLPVKQSTQALHRITETRMLQQWQEPIHQGRYMCSNSHSMSVEHGDRGN